MDHSFLYFAVYHYFLTVSVSLSHSLPSLPPFFPHDREKETPPRKSSLRQRKGPIRMNVSALSWRLATPLGEPAADFPAKIAGEAFVVDGLKQVAIRH